MVEITIPIVLQLIQTVALLVGILYYITIMRNQQRTRELTLESQELTRKAQEQTLKTRNATFFHQVAVPLISNVEGIRYLLILQQNTFSSVEEQRELLKNPEYLTALIWLETSLEIIGIYLREGVIDIETISRFQPWFWIWFWGTYRDVIYDLRKRTNRPSYFRNGEYVLNKIKEYLEEHPELKT